MLIIGGTTVGIETTSVVGIELGSCGSWIITAVVEGKTWTQALDGAYDLGIITASEAITLCGGS